MKRILRIMMMILKKMKKKKNHEFQWKMRRKWKMAMTWRNLMMRWKIDKLKFWKKINNSNINRILNFFWNSKKKLISQKIKIKNFFKLMKNDFSFRKILKNWKNFFFWNKNFQIHLKFFKTDENKFLMPKNFEKL